MKYIVQHTPGSSSSKVTGTSMILPASSSILNSISWQHTNCLTIPAKLQLRCSQKPTIYYYKPLPSKSSDSSPEVSAIAHVTREWCEH